MLEGSMRILVVEDEVKVAGFVSEALAAAGYTVDVEYTGTTGEAAMMNSAHDLVILDHLLPGVTGQDLCRKARAAGDATPILMVTARDAISDRVGGLDAGADDYLTKPFAIDELLARVRALLRRNAQTQAAVLTVEDLALDITRREVRRAGKSIVLSAREYVLLEFLMRHAGRTVTRQMIAEQVWGFNFDTASNVVEVYVSYLRSKIDSGTERKLIRTMRGVGYQLG